MSGSARITDVKALSDLRPAVIRFSEDAQSALVSVGSDAARVLAWIQRERLPHWKREIRIRSEEAVRANTKLIQQTAGEAPRPSVDARKAYELAKRRVKEAEEKYERTRYWARNLEREIDRYRTAVQQMAGIARAHSGDAVTRLESLINALDAYTSEAPPPESSPGSLAAPDDTDGAEREEDA